MTSQVASPPASPAAGSSTASPRPAPPVEHERRRSSVQAVLDAIHIGGNHSNEKTSASPQQQQHHTSPPGGIRRNIIGDFFGTHHGSSSPKIVGGGPKIPNADVTGRIPDPAIHDQQLPASQSSKDPTGLPGAHQPLIGGGGSSSAPQKHFAGTAAGTHTVHVADTGDYKGQHGIPLMVESELLEADADTGVLQLKDGVLISLSREGSSESLHL
ncbi:hypothetical protein DFS34DRAFT_605394 [Phlyctochytrium arcticum]|nr:hypothetical protein DFS34DRAFT_605394 [Phlyctochytrium arcticum]